MGVSIIGVIIGSAGPLLFAAGFTISNLELTYYALITLVYIVYNVYFVVNKGGTPGKLLFNLRIVDKSNSFIRPSRVLLRISFDLLGLIARSAVKFVPFGITPFVLIVGLDGMTALYNNKKRAAHDFIAGTYVISTKRQPAKSKDTTSKTGQTFSP